MIEPGCKLVDEMHCIALVLAFLLPLTMAQNSTVGDGCGEVAGDFRLCKDWMTDYSCHWCKLQDGHPNTIAVTVVMGLLVVALLYLLYRSLFVVVPRLRRLGYSSVQTDHL